VGEKGQPGGHGVAGCGECEISVWSVTSGPPVVTTRAGTSVETLRRQPPELSTHDTHRRSRCEATPLTTSGPRQTPVARLFSARLCWARLCWARVRSARLGG
jgi:hypothetical protein